MIGSIVGSIAQYGSAKGAAAAQANALAEQMARLQGISVPEAQKLVIEELRSQGQLTPELQEALTQAPSEVAEIQEDPALREVQTQALELIKQRAQGGLSAADRASYNQLRGNVARDQAAKEQQILQQMQARGLGGSGAELAMQLANAQNSSQQASEESDRLAAQASRNAMEAAAQMGSQSGQLRSQDFDIAGKKASAQDEYNRFDVTNRQNVANTNVGARNVAQEYNLGEKQRISDVNVGNRNREQVRYQDALQDQFNNQWKKATGMNAITGSQGENEAKKALAKGQMIAGIGKSVDDTGSQAAKMIMMSDEREKKDIKRFDSKAFLDKLVGATFKYKDKSHGEGEHTGVMAQDLEKTPEGSALVKDTPKGKMVDYGKASSLMLASLADLNSRLKNLEGN